MWLEIREVEIYIFALAEKRKNRPAVHSVKSFNPSL